MISQGSISSNLQAINHKYLKAGTPKEALFWSKLALLELCGWIEESMDDIVMRCAMRHLSETTNRKYTQNEIVQRTYGFDYQRNFRFMLIRLLGLVNVEKIEARVDRTKTDRMTATLSSLKTQRDAEAHTHLKGMLRRINAPSVTITQFQPLYEGLLEFDRVIRSRRW